MKKNYSGFLNIDEYGCLTIGDNYLIDLIDDDFKKGDKIFIRYYITDKEVTDEEAAKAHIIKTIGGEIDELDFILDAYSEYTILDYNEELKIGGHDLFDELCNSDGKYLNLIIEKK